MPQFDVYRYRDGYLLDCQADILDRFDTRFVVPLVPHAPAPREFPRLMPVFQIADTTYVMATQLASAIPIRELRQPAGSLAEHRYAIQAALDMLVSGY